MAYGQFHIIKTSCYYWTGKNACELKREFFMTLEGCFLMCRPWACECLLSLSLHFSPEQFRWWAPLLWWPSPIVLPREEKAGVRTSSSHHGIAYNKVALVFPQALSSLSSWPPPLWSDRSVRAMARTPQGTGGFSSTVLTTDLPLVTLASPLSPIAINSVVAEGRDEEPTTHRPLAPSAEKLNMGGKTWRWTASHWGR